MTTQDKINWLIRRTKEIKIHLESIQQVDSARRLPSEALLKHNLKLALDHLQITYAVLESCAVTMADALEDRKAIRQMSKRLNGSVLAEAVYCVFYFCAFVYVMAYTLPLLIHR